jgi:GNAT superfamily N-acetyltransferase
MTNGDAIRCEPVEPPVAVGGPRAQEGWRAMRGGEERARLALWWHDTPPLAGERLGTIGALWIGDGERAAEDAAALLRQACARLAAQGCRRVLAPMDGNSWGAYRCRLDPPLGFAGEPAPGPRWRALLESCGFEGLTRYVSNRCDDLSLQRAAPRARRRLARVRLLTAAGPDADEALLPALHALVHEAFRQQPWFRPLSVPAFAAVARQRLADEPSRFQLVAVDGGEPVGLLLAQRCQERLVVRTLAVRPGPAHAGLGALLLEEAHRAAGAAGCRTALHTLMQAPGPSLALSRHYGAPVARYLLLGRRLGPGGRGGGGAGLR